MIPGVAQGILLVVTVEKQAGGDWTLTLVKHILMAPPTAKALLYNSRVQVLIASQGVRAKAKTPKLRDTAGWFNIPSCSLPAFRLVQYHTLLW